MPMPIFRSLQGYERPWLASDPIAGSTGGRWSCTWSPTPATPPTPTPVRPTPPTGSKLVLGAARGAGPTQLAHPERRHARSAAEVDDIDRLTVADEGDRPGVAAQRCESEEPGVSFAAGSSLAQAGVSGPEAAVGLIVFVDRGQPERSPYPWSCLPRRRPARRDVLDGWKTWLSAHNAAVMAVLFLVFGVVLFSQGLMRPLRMSSVAAALTGAGRRRGSRCGTSRCRRSPLGAPPAGSAGSSSGRTGANPP